MVEDAIAVSMLLKQAVNVFEVHPVVKEELKEIEGHQCRSFSVGVSWNASRQVPRFCLPSDEP